MRATALPHPLAQLRAGAAVSHWALVKLNREVLQPNCKLVLCN